MNASSDELALRRVTTADLHVLNKQLIEDQNHDNPSDLAALERRMHRWLSGAYTVGIIESDGAPAAYAVWREDEDGVYLRQFFVVREQRRSGIGRRAFALLQRDWNTLDVRLDVLLHNERAQAFWRSVGFRDYSLALRRPANSDTYPVDRPQCGQTSGYP